MFEAQKSKDLDFKTAISPDRFDYRQGWVGMTCISPGWNIFP